VRLVAEGGTVAVDARATRPGRGLYLCPDPACAALARRRKAFARRLSPAVHVSDDLESRLAQAAGGRA
jgi:uncharacterized protein